MALAHVPVAHAALLIRKPIAEVFEAFVDPSNTTKFWFSKSSGRLEAGKQVQWDWEMYGSSVPVDVKVVEPSRRIVLDWGPAGAATTVEWLFSKRADDFTFIDITNSGFTGTDDEQVQKALDSATGFTLVLAGLKAWLEHHIELNLVPDRHPDLIVKR